jgi:hypothetical protein
MTVVDAGDFSKIENWSVDGDKFSNRVSSLTNGSIQFLKGKYEVVNCLSQAYNFILQLGAGVWDRVEQSRTCAIEEMQVCFGYVGSSHS